jgi:hypothetical protein
MADESRDVGVVIVLAPAPAPAPESAVPRVRLAHYVRPIERDGGGHIQRRPPAVLSAWNERAERLDHFYWAITDELAMRAGLERRDFEDAQVALARHMAGIDSALGPTDARH